MQGSLDKVEYEIKDLKYANSDNWYKIDIKVPMELGWIKRLKFVIEKDGVRSAFPLEFVDKNDGYAFFKGYVKLDTAALYHYYFTFEANDKFVYFKKKNITDEHSICDEEKWKLSVNYETPEWAKGKIMYHIFVDRFNRKDNENFKPMPRRNMYRNWNDKLKLGPDKDGIWNNDFYGGNLKGIIDKLDYIKSLGATILYLSPVVESQSNHRYDTADYENVDPYAGCNEDLRKLCYEAHKRGMRVVLDSVFNHTGNDSKYFNEFGSYPNLGAYQSKTSPYYKFYRTNYDEGYVPKFELADKFPSIGARNSRWINYIYEARGIVDLWYHFDKDHKNEPEVAVLPENIQKWAQDYFTKNLKLDEKTIKYQDNKFWYNHHGKYVPINNRMIYILYSLEDKVEKIDNIKEVFNFLTIDALLVFYKTKSGDKLSLIFDEFKKIYPENTLYHIIDYIRKVDITKAVKKYTDEKIDEKSNKPFRKYLHNDKNMFSTWWGMPNLPVCNGNSKEWQDYIYGEGGVIDKWFSLGIDGLRLDVADELSDEFIEGIRRAVKRNKEDGFIIGEVWKNPMRMNRGYISSGKGMDSVMNYQLADALIRYFKYEDFHKLRNIIREIENEYPKETIDVLMNFTSTHDITRAINIFGTYEFQYSGEWAWNPNNGDIGYAGSRKLTKEEYERGKTIYKAYVYTLAFMPGILSIFYGDEAGLEGHGNLANRKAFPWGKEDMDLVNFFRSIGNIREEEKFLEKADLNVRDVNPQFFMFERESDDEKALITVNRSFEPIKTPIPEDYYASDAKYGLNGSDKYEIKPLGGLVLKKKLK